mgnify:CR=1 FL=1
MTGYRPEGLAEDAGPADDGNAPTKPVGTGVAGWPRWMWRQLTSMRVALLLLLMLAVAALPGAFLPQRPQDPARVAQYYIDHPGAAPILERWGFFDVYASPWFAAIYLLLFISLVGCIIPRAIEHGKALRKPPPRAPSRFKRFPVRAAFSSPLSAEQARAKAQSNLRGYRVRSEPGDVTTLSAEKGYSRETGNIVFHLALVGLLVSMGYGSLVHYRGQVIVVEGDTFANSRIAYDSFDAGPWFADDDLSPFRMRLESFTSAFSASGAPSDFRANVALITPEGDESDELIRVNHPLRAGDASVFLMGNGFAPRVTVHDGAGNLAFSQPVPFIPVSTTSYTSRGVIKVPDTTTGVQIGLNGVFLPDGVVNEDGEAFTVSPEPNNPVLVLDLWYGNLGLDDGVPQNVYQLDTSLMTQVTETPENSGAAATADAPYRVVVRPGETVELPDGLGAITFDDLPRYVGLDLRFDPTLGWVLGFAVAAFLGVSASLFLPRRRVFVRIGQDDAGRTVVTAAALARGDDPGLARELERVLEGLRSPESKEPTDPGKET